MAELEVQSPRRPLAFRGWQAALSGSAGPWERRGRGGLRPAEVSRDSGPGQGPLITGLGSRGPGGVQQPDGSTEDA